MTPASIRYDAFERNIDKYIEAGVEGFLVAGSNGESVYLEHSEKLSLIEAARRRVPSSMTLLAGTGVESTQATITLTREAADRGADAVLVKNPFYFKAQMTFDAYKAHYTAVADASPVPVIIYNVPVFTGIALQSRLVIELSKHPNIRGLERQFGRCEVDFRSRLEYRPVEISGSGGGRGYALPAMVAGARGGIIALACAAPKAALLLYRAFVAGDYQKAGAHSTNHCPGCRSGYREKRYCRTEDGNGTRRISGWSAATALTSAASRNSKRIWRRFSEG